MQALVGIGNTLLLIIILSVFLGILISFSGKIPLIGKLPGDLYIRKWGLHIYLPLTSSILITLLFSWVLKNIK